jgi:hypothetical protein
MLILAQVSFILLLFIFIYLFIHNQLILILRATRIRSRLLYPHRKWILHGVIAYLGRYSFLYRNISLMLESAHSKIQVKGFFQLTVMLMVAGILAGSILFTNLKGVVVLGFAAGLTPYILLRMRLVGLQMKSRMDFLPAVEVFYQYYVLSGHKNLRSVLKESLEEKRIMYPMKPLFEQLYHNLSTHRDTDESLEIFALSLGHIWVDYFANILRMGLVEGIDISNNIKSLIADMRKAQRANQVERNRLLEIRIANFTPVFFLAVFLSINFKINFQNSYHYYMVDAAGRNMLLDALLLIFASFVMGLYLSIKRM